MDLNIKMPFIHRIIAFFSYGTLAVVSCHAAPSSITLEGKDPTGIIWSSDPKSFKGNYSSKELLDLLNPYKLILSSDAAGTSLISMPIDVEDAEGWAWGITGTIKIHIPVLLGLGYTKTWSSDSAIKAVNNGELINTGTLVSVSLGDDIDFEVSDLQLHLVCKTGSCNFKDLRKKGSVKTPAIYMNLKNGGILFHSSSEEKIFDEQVLEIIDPCKFVVDTTPIRFRDLLTDNAYKNGSILDTATTSFSINCGAGMNGAVPSIKLTPKSGYANNLANFYNDQGLMYEGLKLVYGLQDTEVSGCGASDGNRSWGEMLNIDSLDQNGLYDGRIYWGLCYQSSIEAGSYKTTVTIEAWVN